MSGIHHQQGDHQGLQFYRALLVLWSADRYGFVARNEMVLQTPLTSCILQPHFFLQHCFCAVHRALSLYIQLAARRHVLTPAKSVCSHSTENGVLGFNLR
jgi:hypothetical protein